MSIRIDNHYIPRLIFKNFSQENKFYEYLIAKKTWNLQNGDKTNGWMTSSGIGKEKFLYVIEDENGIKDDSLEIIFSNIESQINPLILKLINTKINNNLISINKILSKSDIENLLYFISLGYFRTKGFLEESGKTIETFKLILLKEMGLPEEELINNGEITVSNESLHEIALNKDNIDELYIHLKEYQFFILQNDTKFNLLISDSFMSFKKSGYAKNRNEVYVPLSNDKLLLGINTSEDLSWFINFISNKQKRIQFFKDANYFAIKNSMNSIFTTNRDLSVQNFIEKHVNEESGTNLQTNVGNISDFKLKKTFKKVKNKHEDILNSIKFIK